MRARTDADRWATRLLIMIGATSGGLLGVLYAPGIWGDLRPLGVDEYALGPGGVIITIAICLGGVVGWWVARRR